MGTVNGYGHPVAMHTTLSDVATIVRHARCLDRAQSVAHALAPDIPGTPHHPFRSRVASPDEKGTDA